jgi:hypothetical protein
MRATQWQRGILIIVLILVSVWLGYNIVGLFGKAPIAVSQANEAKGQYQALEKRKATLQANLDALSTERGQDGAIRTAFGVARPGEEVIVVVPSATTSATSTPSLWQQVMDWF